MTQVAVQMRQHSSDIHDLRVEIDLIRQDLEWLRTKFVIIFQKLNPVNSARKILPAIFLD
jgi:hypothetical protein